MTSGWGRENGEPFFTVYAGWDGDRVRGVAAEGPIIGSRTTAYVVECMVAGFTATVDRLQVLGMKFQPRLVSDDSFCFRRK